MKRPLVPVALLFAAGVALASVVEVSLAPLFAAALACGLLALGWNRGSPILLPAFIFFCGWVNTRNQAFADETWLENEGCQCMFQGEN